jgi:hypothetical protein
VVPIVVGLNFSKVGCVATLSIYNLVLVDLPMFVVVVANIVSNATNVGDL